MNESAEFLAGVSTTISFIFFGLEILFIIWTISNIKKIKDTIEVLKNRVDFLYSERTSDFKKQQELEKRIEKIEQQNKNTPE